VIAGAAGGAPKTKGATALGAATGTATGAAGLPKVNGKVGGAGGAALAAGAMCPPNANGVPAGAPAGFPKAKSGAALAPPKLKAGGIDRAGRAAGGANGAAFALRPAEGAARSSLGFVLKVRETTGPSALPITKGIDGAAEAGFCSLSESKEGAPRFALRSDGDGARGASGV
jgi:hypothetical protein